MTSFETGLNAFATMFATLDPIAGPPFLLALTQGLNRMQRRQIARRASIAVAFILILFACIGMALLRYLGISVAAFNIAGGLLLFWTAFEMIYGRRQEQRQEISEEAKEENLYDVAIFPLAFPLMAGPGAISATILLSQDSNDISSMLLLLSVIITCVVIMYLLFTLAEPIKRYISKAGQIMFARFLGLLLAALSVQYIIDGIKGSIGI